MPVLVLIDVQKEYIAQGRAFCLDSIEESLKNLQKLLAHARSKSWKIVHIRHQQSAEYFTYGSEFADFIEDFGPVEGEKEILKSDFSCFSAPEFTALADKYRNQEILVAGYGATMCCLSTLIDAHHRGYEFTFVSDATCAKRNKKFSEQQLKDFTVSILPAFCNVTTTEGVLNRSDTEEE